MRDLERTLRTAAPPIARRRRSSRTGSGSRSATRRRSRRRSASRCSLVDDGAAAPATVAVRPRARHRRRGRRPRRRGRRRGPARRIAARPGGTPSPPSVPRRPTRERRSARSTAKARAPIPIAVPASSRSPPAATPSTSRTRRSRSRSGTAGRNDAAWPDRTALSRPDTRGATLELLTDAQPAAVAGDRATSTAVRGAADDASGLAASLAARPDLVATKPVRGAARRALRLRARRCPAIGCAHRFVPATERAACPLLMAPAIIQNAAGTGRSSSPPTSVPGSSSPTPRSAARLPWSRSPPAPKTTSSRG